MRFVFSILMTAVAVFTLHAAEEVLRADRWGFDPDDSTAQLQKALDSGAKKMTRCAENTDFSLALERIAV